MRPSRTCPGSTPPAGDLYYLDMSVAGLTTRVVTTDSAACGLAVITRGSDCALTTAPAARVAAGELDAPSQRPRRRAGRTHALA
ncbi:MAG: hypothetical protein J7M38_08200 [Armatimonadetes bacterium]|nr:hypothetical protein [Armatimonadota bacterium]